MKKESIKLLVVNTHPVNYHVPIYRGLANHKEISVGVVFLWDVFSNHYQPKNSWNMQYSKELLNGYDNQFIKNYGLKSGSGFFGFINIGLFKKILFGHYDAVFIFGYNNLSAWITVIASKLIGAKVIFKGESDLLSERGRIKKLIKKFYVSLFFKFVDCFSYSYKKNLAYYQHYSNSFKESIFMPCAVDNQYFQALSNSLNKDELKQKLGMPLPKIIVFAGRLIERKDPETLLKAFFQIKMDDTALIFIGDGELKSTLEVYAKSNNIPNVFFTGFQPHETVNQYLKIADCLVLPSLSDPSPKIVNEAMNFQLPILVSDRVGTANDLVIHSVNGFVFQALNGDDLAKHLQQLLEDAKLREQLGSNALKTVSLWQYDVGVNELVRYLKDTIK